MKFLYFNDEEIASLASTPPRNDKESGVITSDPQKRCHCEPRTRGVAISISFLANHSTQD